MNVSELEMELLRDFAEKAVQQPAYIQNFIGLLPGLGSGLSSEGLAVRDFIAQLARLQIPISPPDLPTYRVAESLVKSAVAKVEKELDELEK